MTAKASSELREHGGELAALCIVSLVVAASWPLIYPGLDFLLAIVGFAESPGLVSLLTDFGPLYGQDPDAPGFFRGMAEASQELSGEHPALAEDWPRHRELQADVEAARTVDEAIAVRAVPRFRGSLKKEVLMEPGKTYEFTIKLYPTSNVF